MTRKSAEECRAEKIRRLLGEEADSRQIRNALRQCLNDSQQARGMLAALLASSDCAVACLDTDGTYLFVNSEYARTAGLPAGAFIGRQYFELFPDTQNIALCREVSRSGVPGFIFSRPFFDVRFPGNGITYWDQCLVPIKNGRDEIENLMLTFSNVTARRKAEKRAERFRALAEKAEFGMLIIDCAGRVDYANNYYARVNGCLPEEIKGTCLSERLYEQDRPLIRQMLDKLRDTGAQCVRELRHVRRDGEIFPMLVTLIPVTGKINVPDFVVVTAIDISDQKKLEKDLLEAEKMALTGRLATYVIHEATSPLQAIMIILSRLKKMENSHPVLAEELDLLKESFDAVYQTINNLMDMNRPSLVKRSPTSINRLIKKTVSQLGVLLRKNRIAVDLDLSPDVPDLTVSPQHLNQCLLNICNNAVEAIAGEKAHENEAANDSQGGTINIKTESDDKRVWIIIADTGPGLDPQEEERLFEPFYTKKRTSLGIGLARCRDVVENEGGTIEVDNGDEGGAMVTITLPLAW